MSDYKVVTIQDLIDFVNEYKDYFPDGLNTQIFTGDFEGNYTHIKHEIQADKHKRKKVVVLGYEMHENYGE